MTGATLAANPVTTPGRLRSGGRHRKKPLHRKEVVGQQGSVVRRIAFGTAAAVLVAFLACAGLIAKWATDDSVPVADAGPSPSEAVPVEQPAGNVGEAESMTAAPTPFPSDDRGFIDSSARCRGRQPAYAIGRTPGSLVVICGEETGRYEYLGVRLSDAAVLRTAAQTDSARSFLARKSGVLYAVSPTELKVTSGGEVIKQEPMIEYREVAR